MNDDTLEAGLDLAEVKSLAEAAHDEIATLRALVDALAQRQTEALEDHDPLLIGNVLHLAGELDPEGETDAEYKAIRDEIEAVIGFFPLRGHQIVPFARTRRVSKVLQAIERYRQFERQCEAMDAVLEEWAFVGFGK